MEIYFIAKITEGVIHLDGEQFRHAVKVMRKRPGDRIQLTDGKGHRAEATIIGINKRLAELRLDALTKVPEGHYHIDIAVALTKNARRIEWALEKMTELGVRSVTPINCAHSERNRVNAARLKKIAIAAIKQSRQYYLPELREPVAFNSFCQGIVKGYDGAKYIAHLSEKSHALHHNYQPGQDVVIMIGPEGDFAEEELEMARECGCVELKLGKTRLRTETAAVAAVAYIHALNE